MRLSQWQPDFKPGEFVPQIHAQLWIKIFGLSQEYWHPRHIMEISRGVGTPLQLDPATKEQRYGYFARVLVDVDLQGALPTSIMVERENFCFPVDIQYENLPPQCSHCGIIGHEKKNCRQWKPQLVKKKEVRQEYQAKPSALVTPVAAASALSVLNDDLRAIVPEAPQDTGMQEGCLAIQHAAPLDAAEPSPLGNPMGASSSTASAPPGFPSICLPACTDNGVVQSDGPVMLHESPNKATEEADNILEEGFESRAVMELDAVARFVNGEDIDGFTPVLTKSQQKRGQVKKTKMVASVARKNPVRDRTMPKRLQ